MCDAGESAASEQAFGLVHLGVGGGDELGEVVARDPQRRADTGADEVAYLESGAGTYRVVVSGYEQTTGEFQMSLEQAAALDDEDLLRAAAENLES